MADRFVIAFGGYYTPDRFCTWHARPLDEAHPSRVIRHPAATSLPQPGVTCRHHCLTVHESIETPHGYLEADLKFKEQALGKLAQAGKGFQPFRAEDPLLAFLASL